MQRTADFITRFIAQIEFIVWRTQYKSQTETISLTYLIAKAFSGFIVLIDQWMFTETITKRELAASYSNLLSLFAARSGAFPFASSLYPSLVRFSGAFIGRFRRRKNVFAGSEMFTFGPCRCQVLSFDCFLYILLLTIQTILAMWEYVQKR